MKILFTSSTCSRGTYEEVFLGRNKRILDPMQKFLLQIMMGVAKNCEVISISIKPYSYSTYNKRIIKGSGDNVGDIRFIYPGFINGRLSRFITTYISVFFNTLKILIRNRDIVIITDPLNPFICKPTRAVARLTKKKCIAIVTDLPLEATKMKERKESKAKILFTRIYEHYANFGIDRFDGYIFLTNQMNSVINKKEKPYCVIEGTVDDSHIRDINTIQKKENSDLLLLYAGGVYEKYGVKNLVEAFIAANMPNTKLHIYGEGSYVDDLIQIADAEKEIDYKGCVLNDELEGIERSADVLINPRLSNSEYTKYSFPSKTLEYMSSGTATLSTRLPGIPEEYKDYLLWFDDESVEGMKKTLQNIVKIGRKKLNEIGLRAQEFVIKEKNNVVQGQKIIRLAKNVSNTNA